VLASAIGDTLETLPALPRFWLQLARRLGLIVPDVSGERLVAAGPDFWVDNAVHLPQMIATGWLGLEGWSEVSAALSESDENAPPMHFLRPALLLWLACLEPEKWVTLEDLGNQLHAMNPIWDQPGWQLDLETATPLAQGGSSSRARNDAAEVRFARGERLLRSVLLGAGYPLGLVHAGQEKETGRTVVQLTPLGRYVLAIGPPPAPRQAVEHFLFVQPNFEIIAYRQGLTAQLVGRLSRFAKWTKVGAATELELSQESIVHGLEGGMTSAQMLELLTRHSQRPLPATVLDALERWSNRRERITFYTAATLIEFDTAAERDLALARWQETAPKTFVPIAKRFLLVENPQEVPNDRIRARSSRDYRYPPEPCVSIESDGITLALDPSRADLFIDSELAWIADEVPAIQARSRSVASAAPVRRFTISADSMIRAAAMGFSRTQIVNWFERRTGGPPSPAIQLLIRDSSRPTALIARRMLVLSTTCADMADGLLQHPATRHLVGQRLGPTALSVPEDQLDELVKALALLRYKLAIE
ncbi:MAG: helicase-associated domain-containing protein, partial [Planctomycetaceae bacterium]|nr:helicase-associated domain-containing protein [Planctomycetaceae bacterium]